MLEKVALRISITIRKKKEKLEKPKKRWTLDGENFQNEILWLHASFSKHDPSKEEQS